MPCLPSNTRGVNCSLLLHFCFGYYCCYSRSPYCSNNNQHCYDFYWHLDRGFWSADCSIALRTAKTHHEFACGPQSNFGILAGQLHTGTRQSLFAVALALFVAPLPAPPPGHDPSVAAANRHRPRSLRRGRGRQDNHRPWLSLFKQKRSRQSQTNPLRYRADARIIKQTHTLAR